MMKNEISIVGMGPGREDMMTLQAVRALEEADVIVGYTVYLQLLDGRFRDKELLSTPMRQETERCEICFGEAQKGKRVALLCSGDAGIYGMASLMYDVGQKYPQIRLKVIPGITAACSGAALLGAPLGQDFCVVSLSDLLIPWEKIGRRLEAAAQGDFALVLYNPGSHKRKDHLKKACDILLQYMEETRICGCAEKIGREGTRVTLCTLRELRNIPVNMFTTVFVGSSDSVLINGKMVTRRGYKVEGNIAVCGDN